jgi:hypothetical protein
MSTGMRTFNVALLNAASVASNQIASVPIPYTLLFAVQAVFTGTPSGSIALYASNDNISYEQLPNSMQTISASGSFMWNYVGSGYAYVQVQFAAATGGSSGTVSVSLNSKGF